MTWSAEDLRDARLGRDDAILVSTRLPLTVTALECMGEIVCSKWWESETHVLVS